MSSNRELIAGVKLWDALLVRKYPQKAYEYLCDLAEALESADREGDTA